MLLVLHSVCHSLEKVQGLTELPLGPSSGLESSSWQAPQALALAVALPYAAASPSRASSGPLRADKFAQRPLCALVNLDSTRVCAMQPLHQVAGAQRAAWVQEKFWEHTVGCVRMVSRGPLSVPLAPRFPLT